LEQKFKSQLHKLTLALKWLIMVIFDRILEPGISCIYLFDWLPPIQDSYNHW